MQEAEEALREARAEAEKAARGGQGGAPPSASRPPSRTTSSAPAPPRSEIARLVGEATKEAEAAKAEAEQIVADARAEAERIVAEAEETARAPAAEDTAAQLAKAARTRRGGADQGLGGRAGHHEGAPPRRPSGSAARRRPRRTGCAPRRTTSAEQLKGAAKDDTKEYRAKTVELQEEARRLRGEAEQLRAEAVAEGERIRAEARREAVQQIEEAASTAEELLAKAKAGRGRAAAARHRRERAGTDRGHRAGRGAAPPGRGDAGAHPRARPSGCATEAEEQAEAGQDGGGRAGRGASARGDRARPSRPAGGGRGELTRLHAEAEQRLASAEQALRDARAEAERIRREAAEETERLRTEAAERIRTLQAQADAGGTQQVHPRRIAVIGLVAEPPHEVDLFGTVFDRDEWHVLCDISRATIWPKRPSLRSAPVRAGRRSVVLRSGFGRILPTNHDMATSNGGVSAIDTPTIATSRSRSTASNKPARLRLPEHHEGELAAQGQHAGHHQGLAHLELSRAHADAEEHAEFHRHQSTSTPTAMVTGSATTRVRLMLMPTAMKNRPSSRPLKGSMSRLELVAELRIRQQHAGEERAERHAQSGHLHHQRAAQHHQQRGAVNTSGMRVRATQRNTWRSSSRPPNTNAAIASIAFSTSQPIGCASRRRAWPSSGISRQQWNRREILEQQDREAESPVFAGQRLALCQQLQADRGRRQRQTNAIDDGGSPVGAHARWPARRVPAPTTPPAGRPRRTPACASPAGAPGDNSSPITNSSITTPIWLAASTGSASRTTRKPYGPSAKPAARYPGRRPGARA